ncbi:MAG: HAD hydrolase-like protein [Actinomycetota bacterium]|nr:HAD hydrolase-like protein [Actinomycetota bacterium]MDA2980151.1 HAD hydrolase-like protein [Actinomycetota bacterium]MDA3003073.1 HAD hydrolase-like protein [Actinomycetota bacterium]
MLKYQSVLLDLDGTLVDSSPGIVSTIAYTLEEMGRDVPTMKDLLRWVGPPLPESFATRGGMSSSEVAEAIGIYRARYLNVGVYDAKLFDGVSSLLRGLKDAGAHLAIATSKPTTPATIMLEHFTLSDYFSVIACAADDETRGTKAEVVEDALAGLREKGLPTDNTIMVGDRIHDVEGAAHHGLDTIMVRWGYGGPTEWEQAHLVIDTPQQLHQALGIPGGHA